MDFDALIRMAAALGAVLGLVLLAAWAMRRYGLAGIANLEDYLESVERKLIEQALIIRL